MTWNRYFYLFIDYWWLFTIYFRLSVIISLFTDSCDICPRFAQAANFALFRNRCFSPLVTYYTITAWNQKQENVFNQLHIVFNWKHMKVAPRNRNPKFFHSTNLLLQCPKSYHNHNNTWLQLKFFFWNSEGRTQTCMQSRILHIASSLFCIAYNASFKRQLNSINVLFRRGCERWKIMRKQCAMFHFAYFYKSVNALLRAFFEFSSKFDGNQLRRLNTEKRKKSVHYKSWILYKCSRERRDSQDWFCRESANCFGTWVCLECEMFDDEYTLTWETSLRLLALFCFYVKFRHSFVSPRICIQKLRHRLHSIVTLPAVDDKHSLPS